MSDSDEHKAYLELYNKGQKDQQQILLNMTHEEPKESLVLKLENKSKEIEKENKLGNYVMQVPPFPHRGINRMYSNKTIQEVSESAGT